jgi:hypothetical protein
MIDRQWRISTQKKIIWGLKNNSFDDRSGMLDKRQ